LSFVGLHTYTLTEFHLHAPSEHRINGKQFPLEIHYLHDDGKGHYATLVLLYDFSEDGEGTSWFLQMLAIMLPSVPTDNSSTTVPSLDIESQVNTAGGYYYYEGSTTTPPCTPGVQWFVVKDPILVDPLVLSIFTSVLNNSRPIQPLNGRQPTLFRDGSTSGIDKWVLAIGLSGIGLLGVLTLMGISRYLYRLYHAKSYENQQELVGFLGSTNNDHL
jgi:hypothetical protein